LKNYFHRVGHEKEVKIDVWSHHCANCCLPESQQATSETKSRNTVKIPVRFRKPAKQLSLSSFKKVTLPESKTTPHLKKITFKKKQISDNT
jgi:hypothetical protein